jgi:hypothetical protein
MERRTSPMQKKQQHHVRKTIAPTWEKEQHEKNNTNMKRETTQKE